MTDQPLRLSTGSHQAGSGRGCAMNVISWENGDSRITDFPACSDPMLARIVQRVNDSICTHTTDGLLCPTCSIEVLRLGHRTVGTGGLLEGRELHRVWVLVACDQARQVAHLNTDPRVMAAIEAAEAWAKNPTARAAADAADAATYAHAADAATYAAYAARAAAYAATYAHAADAAADAADAATYAYAARADAYAAAAYAARAAAATYAAAARLALAHRAIDRFIELTGHVERQPDPHQTAAAVERMLAGS